MRLFDFGTTIVIVGLSAWFITHVMILTCKHDDARRMEELMRQEVRKEISNLPVRKDYDSERPKDVLDTLHVLEYQAPAVTQ